MGETVMAQALSSSKAAFPASSNTTWWMTPTPAVLFFSVLLAITVPLLLHFVVFRSGSSSTLPTFLLVGPSGGGKTALQTLIERTPSPHASTVTSQSPLTVEASVPVTITVASNRYRSAADPSAAAHKKFLLTDTPGHGKLRHHALSLIRTSKASHIRGLIFVADATSLGPETPELRDAAEFLHDLLLTLQTQQTARGGGGGAGAKDFPVLVLVNKLDLFTALPANMAARALETEIGKVRSSKAKGLMAAGSKEGEEDDGEEKWLGQGGEGEFAFAQMEDAGVTVRVLGSQLEGTKGAANIGGIWEWMAEQL